MTQPLYWNANEVNDANLQDTMGGPWSRVVDVNLAGNTGRQYDNLQDAWDAAATGDSIFVKSGTYSAGIQATPGDGNTKDGIRIVGESGRSVIINGGQRGLYFDNCSYLDISNIRVESVGVQGVYLLNGNRGRVTNVSSTLAGNDGFALANLEDWIFTGCIAESNVVRGFQMQDGMRRNHFIGCYSTANGSHGFALSAWPASNAYSTANNFQGCFAYNAGGSSDGFQISIGAGASGAKGWDATSFIGCRAGGNAGNGFDAVFAGANQFMVNSVTFEGCHSISNTSNGFNASGSITAGRFVLVANQSLLNGGANWSGIPANTTGYNVRGLTGTGTNF